MLTVQSALNQTTFGQRRAISQDEMEMRQQRAEMLRQKAELEDIARDNDTPGAMKKIARAGALLTAGAAVGLTAGAGTKILIDKGIAFKNSAFMKSAKGYASSFKKAFVETLDDAKKNFKKAIFFQKPMEFISKKFNSFVNSKFVKPIANCAEKAADLGKSGIEKVKSGFDWVAGKLKAIKPETYKKAAVGTVGASSGACAVMNNIKEHSEAGEF